MANADLPVLVVGGGAAGSMLLLELQRRGVGVRCIDRLPGPAPTSRAITVHARTAEIFERIDQRLIDRCRARALPSKGYVLHFVDENGARRSVRPGLDFTTLPGRYPLLFLHGQHDTEQLLRDFTQEQFGGAVEWGTELVDVAHGDDCVVATLRNAQGREEVVRARYLVACDGKNSRVRRTLRLVQDESDYRGSIMQNLDAFLHGFPDTDDYVHYCVGRNHFVMVVKMPGGYHRMLLSDRGEAAQGDSTPQQAFRKIIDQHFDGVGIGEVVWHSKWESWVRLSHTYRDRNVFLAGDSAHVHSTTGGQGMNCCLQDAWNLGWKLALVLQGHAAPRLLETYEAERKPIAEQVIWAASSLHEIFMGHGKSVTERSARMSDPSFVAAVIGRCSGLAYTYRDYISPQAEVAPMTVGPTMGDRAPDLELPDGRSLYAATRTSGFSLWVIAGESISAPAALLTAQQLISDFSLHIGAYSLPACAAVAHEFGTTVDTRYYLVRPDAYIGFCCRESEDFLLRDYLNALLTPKEISQ